MAKHLANIYGTEEDRVNCPFYFKVGACRNGDQCSRQHNRPTSSQTLLLSHMYSNTQESLAIAREIDWTDDQYDVAQKHLEQFYEEVFQEMANFGEIEDMVVVDNISDHMVGNIYVKYYREEDAEKALENLTGRYYGGELIQAEFSPVSDFREARCRQFHESSCNRGGYCNFMHIKHIPRAVKARLVRGMYEEHPEFLERDNKKRKAARGKSREREDRGRGGDRGRDRDRGRDDRYERSDRGRDKGGRDDRGRERDRGRGDGDLGAKIHRSNSEERRAMIAQWADDDKKEDLYCQPTSI
ncbi:unnamed protein product [Amoebophrya sp. A120]|nr:unnamed protein product [Amoebophrya sp. A120]|eukprot:GSA120T00008087001.1